MQKPLTVAEAAKRLEAVLNEAEATAAKWEARRAALEAERLRNRQQWGERRCVTLNFQTLEP